MVAPLLCNSWILLICFKEKFSFSAILRIYAVCIIFYGSFGATNVKDAGERKDEEFSTKLGRSKVFLWWGKGFGVWGMGYSLFHTPRLTPHTLHLKLTGPHHDPSIQVFYNYFSFYFVDCSIGAISCYRICSDGQ